MNEYTHNKSSNVQPDHVIQDETMFNFSNVNAPEVATKKKAKDRKRPKRQADNILPDIDLSEWEDKSYSEILLHCSEALFEIIARAEKLDNLMRYFLVRLVVLAGMYGVCLGWYAWNLQIVASAIKMPLLLLGTMGICFPALFAFNMFLGSKLNMKQTIAILLVANYVMAFFLASLAPILLFFTIASPDKYFVSLLNFTSCTLAGIFFLLFLWKGTRYLTLRAGKTYNPRIIRIWSLIYIFVGTQLSWLLRPFMGDPGTFVLFRDIEGNFYLAMFRVFTTLAEKIM
jgi:hypothetical protein